MFSNRENNTASFTAVLLAVCLAFAVSCAAMLSGGLSAAAAVLWVTGIIFVWLIYGARGAGGAILSALVGAAGVGLLQLTQALPPALFGFSWRVEMWMLLGLAVLGLASMFRLRITSQQHEPVSAQTQPPTDLWQGAPFAVISVTPQGRVRAAAGNTDLLGDVGVGQIFDAANFARDGVIVETAQTPIGPQIYLSVDNGAGQLETRLRERTDFFAGLGHDLKSPLNAVIGFADMMDQELSGPMPEPYREYPGLIKESGETLLRFVEDMLGYARSEAGTYELDLALIDVAASGEAVLRQSEAAATTAGVSLVMETRGEVLAMADAAAVRRMWDNLVSNAIKYSARNGKVTLSAREDADAVIIEVSDDGAGMDAEDLAAIARPFEQGRNARGRAGTGLGLAMVKRLAEMHRGQVRIETAKGNGTTVSVRLLAPPKTMREAAE